MKREWDELKQHDVLFLLAVMPPSEKEAAAQRQLQTVSVPDRYGLQRVRGAEVIEMKDEEGNLINDFTGMASNAADHRSSIRTTRWGLQVAVSRSCGYHFCWSVTWRLDFSPQIHAQEPAGHRTTY
jgi:hypothetical protein